jgi:hypothetical protein
MSKVWLACEAIIGDVDPPPKANVAGVKEIRVEGIAAPLANVAVQVKERVAVSASAQEPTVGIEMVSPTLKT